MSKECGSFFEVRLPECPRGNYLLCDVKPINGKVYAKDLHIVLMGEYGDTGIGWGLMQREINAGKDMAMVFNPDEEVQYPEGIRYIDGEE
jgi:hypothetical protein